MRLLLGTTYPDIVGGTQTYLEDLIPRLRSRGIEVGLVATYRSKSSRPALAPQGVRFWSFEGSDPKRIRREITDWGPKVVYQNGMGDPHLEETVAGNDPAVYYAHNYVGVCASGTKCYRWPQTEVCDRRFGPACVGAQLLRRCGAANPIRGLNLYLRERLRRNVMRRHRLVLANSRAVLTELVRNGFPSERTKLLPLYPPNVVGIGDPPVDRDFSNRILFLGRITDLKGWSELLDAMPLASRTLKRTLTLVVAGDGPDRGRMETEANHRGVPTEFLGWIDADRRETELRRADLLAVPSVWPEPFGLSGVEAGAMGVPAVGFDSGGVPDWLIPGVSGESAPGQRPHADEFAGAMVRALADRTHWQRLRVGAWEVSRRFTPERHLDELLPLLELARNDR